MASGLRTKAVIHENARPAVTRWQSVASHAGSVRALLRSVPERCVELAAEVSFCEGAW